MYLITAVLESWNKTFGLLSRRSHSRFSCEGWLKSLGFWKTDGAARHELDQRWEAKQKAMALVFVNANENLNRVVTVGTEMKEQMGELLWKKLCRTVTILHIIKYMSS